MVGPLYLWFNCTVKTVSIRKPPRLIGLNWVFDLDRILVKTGFDLYRIPVHFRVHFIQDFNSFRVKIRQDTSTFRVQLFRKRIPFPSGVSLVRIPSH
jgi:hypothetical protein